MKVYEIYEHPERGRKAVKVGFSWPCFFFGPYWALAKRLWLTALFLFSTSYGLDYLRDILGDNSILPVAFGYIVILSAISIFFTVYGNRLIAKSLIHRGFQYVSKIAANSRGDAVRRYEESPTTEEPILSPIRKYGPWAALVVFFSLLILVKATVLSYYIPAPGMLNTLKINDRVFANRFAYTFSEPKTGDIIVFRVPETIPNYDPCKPIWIKRIVGLAGDHVTIEDHHLRVNGQEVTDPPFLADNYYDSELPNGKTFKGVTVGEGEVLVFGDNSKNSYDGRYWGTVPVENIIGKAFFRFWPPQRMGEIRGVQADPFKENG